MQKFFHDHRSAIAPVGIVAVVSMKTIMKKNRAITLTSSSPFKKNPLVPNNPYLNAPVAVPSAMTGPMPIPPVSTEVPGPSDEYHPSGTGPLNQLPQPKANPYAQNAMQPNG